MIKLNATIYNKLLAQAEEAKIQGMPKLATGILEAIGSYPNDEPYEYTYTELKDDIHRDLWKVATRLMHYYDTQSVDAEKLDETIVSWASKMLNDLEVVVNPENVAVGPLEPKLPGEDK